MALVVPTEQSPQRNPTASLEEALRCFEGVLTDEQRREFTKNTSNPDASTVILFIGEVDASNQSRKKSVSRLLQPFLEATQQFTAIVDTFVSSNPTIAALIWGGVKTAILAANNTAWYFDKVTKMILEIGKSCPTYALFGQLYKGCVDLQSALCDYYTAIVRICIRIVEVQQRYTVTQILSSIVSPFESDFGPLRESLHGALETVHLQISLASKQVEYQTKKLVELEHAENEKSRRMISRFRSDVDQEHEKFRQWRVDQSLREAVEDRMRALDDLSTINYQKTWSKIQGQRVLGTAEWFQLEPAFQEWRADLRTSILWCPGILGVGKSVLVSSVIEALVQSRVPKEFISYHFCQSAHEATLSARNILGTCARQLLGDFIKYVEGEALLKLRAQTRNLDAEGVVGLLVQHLKDDKIYYIILDGLDECNNIEVQSLAENVKKLCYQCHKNIKILYSSRPELETRLFKDRNYNHRMPLTRDKVSKDNNLYIDMMLEQCYEAKRLKIRDPKLIMNIGNILERDCNGMFLWLSLFIEEICAQNSDEDILEALEHPPRKLSDLFDKKLARVRTQNDATQAIKILQYCGVVKRPLTMNEFREVLSIKPGEESLNQGRLPYQMGQISAACCGLVYVDEQDDTIHYVHHSVGTHLFGGDTHSRTFVRSDTDLDFGYLCLTYLNFSDFKRQIARARPRANSQFQPADLGLEPVGKSFPVAIGLVGKLLSLRKQRSHVSAQELDRKAQEILGESESSRKSRELQERRFAFLDYASKFWLQHTRDLHPDASRKMWRLFCQCLKASDSLANRPWNMSETLVGISDKTDYTADRIMKWALSNRQNALILHQSLHEAPYLTNQTMRDALEYSIHHKCLFVEMVVMKLATTTPLLAHSLLCAVKEGSLKVVEQLLAAKANVNAFSTGRTPLGLAAEKGHTEVVEKLLAAKADVNATASDGWTPLHWAAENGHTEVVEKLLAAKADVHTTSTFDRWTPLYRAAENGHTEVVEKLLAAKADVHTTSTFDGWTPLHRATENGHMEVVEKLLAAKADVNATASDRWTPLHRAAENGHTEVVEKLLAARADVNTTTTFDGWTPLYRAAENGHTEVVEKLLAAKADVNATASDGWTPLHWAAKKGHTEVVEKLLAAKADVNTTSDGWTPLHWAAENGHTEVVEQLLAAKANVNAFSTGRTPLGLAAEKGHTEVVEKLLAAKADVNTTSDGWTPLHWAAKKGHTEVVEKLLAAKADVNATDYFGQTTLHLAAESDNAKIVEMLLAAKADANITDRNGRTALQVAGTSTAKILENYKTPS